MDFYAMQLTPHKKDDEKERREEKLKKIREHVVTKEELLEELKSESNNGKNEKEDNIKSPDFLSEKTFSLQTNESSGKSPLESLNVDPKRVEETLEIEKATEIKEKKVPVTDLLKENLSVADSGIIGSEVKKERKTEITSPDVDEFVIDEDKIIQDTAKALTAFDETKIKDAIARVIAYRSQDPARAASEAEVNIKLKKAIIATLPALFAYKGSKAVMYVLQLLDEFNLNFGYRDFENLPDEILCSAEFKNVCQKYLLWFAREYPEEPGQLQDRIYCFNRCGIIGRDEIKGFTALQLAILSDLVNFIRQNVDDPHDVERKVFEFALAGFVNEKEIKQMPKVRDIIKKFALLTISSKKEKPSEAAKKINEYEKMGFIGSGEIIADEKIGKFIEKYLLKYKKENLSHPRKTAALIREYFNVGLINKTTRDKFLK